MNNNIRIAKRLVKIAKSLVADDSVDKQVLDLIKKYNITVTQYRNGNSIDTQDLEKFLVELDSATNGNFRVFCYGTSNCPFAKENKFGNIDTSFNGKEFLQVFNSKKNEIRTDRNHWTDITADLRGGDVLITLDFRDAFMGSWT